MMNKLPPVLVKQDNIDGWIYVCPHCHHYVTPGIGEYDLCENCHNAYDKRIVINYYGGVKYD